MRRKSRTSAYRTSSAIAPAISTPVGPPPTITVVMKAFCCDVGGHLRLLERKQQSRADIPGILDGLQARRELGPVIVAEVAVERAGCDHQSVVWNNPSFRHENEPACALDAGHLAQHDVDVPVPAQDFANRLGYVRGRQSRGCHLVERGDEQVIIIPVDDRDANIRSAQLGGAGQTAETGADDHDMRVVVDRRSR